jgi:hypothetical protein
VATGYPASAASRKRLRSKGRRLSDPSPEYASIHNWDKIEEFGSIENIPEDLRKSLLLDRYLIYSKARGPD